MREIGFLVALSLGLALPLTAEDAFPEEKTFVVLDEMSYFAGPTGGGGWMFLDFEALHGITTLATAAFAQNTGQELSQYDASRGVIRCLPTDYLSVANAAQELTARGKPVVLDLTHVIYELVDAGVQPQQWRHRADWQSRLANFKNRAGNHYNAETTLFISVHNDVTRTNLASDQIDGAAWTVRQYFPGIKVAAGYPTDDWKEGNLPARFPSFVDLIVTWDYATADPSSFPYFNAANPSDPATTYGKLLKALRPQGNQKIFFQVAGFNNGSVLGSASTIHQLTGVHFGTLLRNWCAFSFERFPERNGGLIVARYSDFYGCQIGVCGVRTCTGLVRRITGANQALAYERSLAPPSDVLVRAYRAVSRAAQFGESCWAP